jgi:hypothetical protein
MYLRDKKFMPVGCVAISLSKNRKQVRYQLSVQNPEDTFKRSLARHIALGRLVEIPVRLNGFDGTQSSFDITLAVMQDILDSPDTPTRAKKSAMNWIKFNTVKPPVLDQ